MRNALAVDRFDSPEARQFTRVPVRCRARIQIGKRHYTGYVENLSEGGAKLVTFTPIRSSGKVLLRMPDLPPLKGDLRWADGTAGGMAFSRKLAAEEVAEWASYRCWRAQLLTREPR